MSLDILFSLINIDSTELVGRVIATIVVIVLGDWEPISVLCFIAFIVVKVESLVIIVPMGIFGPLSHFRSCQRIRCM